MLRNSKGITLVELLIVIVILGIIAAIAVPAVGNIVENAEKDAIIADAQQIESSAQTAAASEDWNVFDYDWSNGEGSNGILSNILDDDNGFDEVIELDDQGYIDGVDEFVAWIYNDNWVVAVQEGSDDGDWLAIGNPDELGRDDVVEIGTDDEESEDVYGINDLNDLGSDDLKGENDDGLELDLFND